MLPDGSDRSRHGLHMNADRDSHSHWYQGVTSSSCSVCRLECPTVHVPSSVALTSSSDAKESGTLLRVSARGFASHVSCPDTRQARLRCLRKETPLQQRLLLSKRGSVGSHANILQSPEVVKVGRGETVRLTCDLVEIQADCSSISWFKTNLRDKDLKRSSVIRTDPGQNVCTGIIRNVGVSDSGVYYCSGVHHVIPYMGSGSTVIVTESNPDPTIMLSVPDQNAGPSVSLQCVLMGVVPSEVRVSWIIGNTEQTGWTESGWTHDDQSAVEYTLAHIRIPSKSWTEEVRVECVTDVNGTTFSKTLEAGYNQMCAWLLYLGSAVVFTIVTAIIIITAVHFGEGLDQTETENTNK
ncbi:uncharacterized protein LOC134300745 [Trichomycterus rosablanca]|uniref:uncharacterized protein LOC134300745 n=1 Tax=Trichomycterus rosablanca TaxID=2290929 RepID=UPI002F35C409